MIEAGEISPIRESLLPTDLWGIPVRRYKEWSDRNDASAPPMLTRGESGLLDVPGGRLYFERSGHGPPIVWIHASIADHRMWDRESEVYSRNWTVVRYDLRGLGRSTPATAPYSDSADLQAVFQHLHLGPATLVGCSMGGRIALDFALEHYDSVRALLLVAPGLSGWTPALDPDGRAVYDQDMARAAEIGAAWSDGRTDQAIEGLLEYWCSATQGANRELVRRMIRENAQEVFTDESAGHCVPLQPPAAERLASIQAPTVVLLGDRDEPTMSFIVRRVARGIPGANFVTVPGADHLINLSKPDAFDEALHSLIGY